MLADVEQDREFAVSVADQEPRSAAGRGDLDAKDEQFAVNPAIAPTRILLGQAQNQDDILIFDDFGLRELTAAQADDLTNTTRKEDAA